MGEAFQNMAECMTNYMTDINLVDIDEEETHELKVSGKSSLVELIPDQL